MSLESETAASAELASGVTISFAIRSGLALLISAEAVWTHRTPSVKRWRARARRQIDLDVIFREATGKLHV